MLPCLKPGTVVTGLAECWGKVDFSRAVSSQRVGQPLAEGLSAGREWFGPERGSLVLAWSELQLVVLAHLGGCPEQYVQCAAAQHTQGFRIHPVLFLLQ